MNVFNQRIKEVRLEKNLSQKELAQELRVSQRAVSSWETGFRQPDYEMLIKLARFFGVSTDYLLGLEE